MLQLCQDNQGSEPWICSFFVGARMAFNNVDAEMNNIVPKGFPLLVP